MKKVIKKIISFLKQRGFFNWMDDSTYLKMTYWEIMDRKLDLVHPRTFNEKLQWLKVNDHNPLYTKLVDKYEVKKYVSDKIGKAFVIPTIGVWENADDIDFEQLPNQFVLKCTHDSGGVIICPDKTKLDVEKAKNTLAKALRKNFYYLGREWPYKNVKPRIIAEKYMVDESGTELKDYKVMCFEGEPRLIQIHRGRFTSHTQDFYDVDWTKLEVTQGVPNSDVIMDKPCFFEQMMDLSKKLSAGMHHVRIDWYYVDGQLLFGEYTFFDASGHDDFEPDEWNYKVGSWIEIEQ